MSSTSKAKISISPSDDKSPIGNLVEARRLSFAAAASEGDDPNVETTVASSQSNNLSIRDISTILKDDTKGLSAKITNTAASFIKALLEIRRRRNALPSWKPATSVKQTITRGQAASSVNIDLLHDFHTIPVGSMKTSAEALWKEDGADHLALDGVSQHYARRCFAMFLFNSMEAPLQRTVQHLIPDENLWNDGPLVWTVWVNHMFPSAGVFTQSTRSTLESLTLTEHKDCLETYTTKFRECLTLLPDHRSNTPDTVYTAFFREMEKHPSPLIRGQFHLYGMDHFLNKKDKKDIIELLAEASQMHSVLASKDLPYSLDASKSTKKGTDDEEVTLKASQVIAMATAIEKSQKDIAALLANGKDSSSKTKRGGRMGNLPPFWTEKPDKLDEEKQWNSRTYRWCQKCRGGKGAWSPTHNTDEHKNENPNKKRNGKDQTKKDKKKVKFDANVGSFQAKATFKELLAHSHGN